MEQDKIQYIKYRPQSESIEQILTEDKNKQNHKNEKLENFKIRLNEFKSIHTLEEAKKLLQATMPVALDRTTFYIGDAKCIIVNTEKRLRICYVSPKEVISYDFV